MESWLIFQSFSVRYLVNASFRVLASSFGFKSTGAMLLYLFSYEVKPQKTVDSSLTAAQNLLSRGYILRCCSYELIDIFLELPINGKVSFFELRLYMASARCILGSFLVPMLWLTRLKYCLRSKNCLTKGFGVIQLSSPFQSSTESFTRSKQLTVEVSFNSCLRIALRCSLILYLSSILQSFVSMV